jgi:PAS domain S-box-containing protein
MSFRQEIEALREAIAGAAGRGAAGPGGVFLRERLNYALGLLGTADDELAKRAVQAEQLAAEVHAARARYQVLFQLLPVACVLTDLAGVVRAVNNAGAVLLGGEAAVIGRALPLRFVEHERGAVRTRITRARLGEPAAWRGNLLRAAGRGEPAAGARAPTPAAAVVNVTLAPLPAPGGMEPGELMWTLVEPGVGLRVELGVELGPQVIEVKPASLQREGGEREGPGTAD